MPDIEVLPEGSPIDDLLGKSDADFAKAVGIKAGLGVETPKPTTTEAVTSPPVKAEGGTTSSAPAPVAETTTPEAETPAVEEAPVEELPKLLTEFSVYDAEGELEIPRDLKFNFKANKKDLKDVPLDKVVLLAQMGFYNQEREDEVHAAKHWGGQLKQENDQLKATVTQLQGQFNELLGDENFYEAARQHFLKENSPEVRALRAEEENQRIRREAQSQEQMRQAAAYFQREISPAVEAIAKAHGLSDDEVLGRFQRMIAPMMQNGVVPLQRLPEIKQLIDNDFTVWAKQISLSRESDKSKQAAALQAERAKAALAKRQVARAAAPPQQAGVASTEKPTPKKYESADEWLSGSLDEILGNIRGNQ